MEQWALQEQMRQDIDRLDGANLQLWATDPSEGAHSGRMSLKGIDMATDTSVYLCGPLPFKKKLGPRPWKLAYRPTGSTTRFSDPTFG